MRLLGALLLALISAALINLGFVFQHRGHAQALAGGRTRLIDGFRNRYWVSGQALGWTGFAGQIVAVALAPLTLVQAFAAGSLAISVPLAAALFGHRVRRAQLVAVGLIALSLASLPIGFGARHGHLQGGVLIGAAMLASLAAIALGMISRVSSRAIAAGVFYGIGDAAIKADALGLRAHGVGALASGWTILVALSTLGGFITFQAALRENDAVGALSLMTAFTAVTAVALGMVAFGEPLGASPWWSLAHAAAIAVVLACVRPLARAQQRLAGAQRSADATEPVGVAERPFPEHAAARPLAVFGRAVLRLLAGAGAILGVLVGALAGIGLLYAFRELRWFAAGPSVPDALPLLQLAGFDGQPLVRVIAAWLPAGLVLGVALIRFSPPRRVLVVGLLGAMLLLLASDSSYALARNLRLGQVLLDREPGLGPWVEALLLAAACALPTQISSWRRLTVSPPAPRAPWTSVPSARSS